MRPRHSASGTYTISLDLYSTDETEVEEECPSSVVVEQKDRRTGEIGREHHLVAMTSAEKHPIVAKVVVSR